MTLEWRAEGNCCPLSGGGKCLLDDLQGLPCQEGLITLIVLLILLGLGLFDVKVPVGTEVDVQEGFGDFITLKSMRWIRIYEILVRAKIP